MITSKHKEELRARFYYVGNSFGGVDSLLESLSLNSINELELEYKVHQILSHKGKVRVITPWAAAFSLTEDILGREEDPILADSFYEVLDLNHKTLYRVLVKEKLEWGHSALDKALILQSFTGDIFYLKYLTVKGYQIDMLIVNALSLVAGNALADDDYLEVPHYGDSKERQGQYLPAKEPSENFIHFQYDNSLSDTNGEVVITLLPSTPLKTPTIDELINHPSAISVSYPLDSEKEGFFYFPKESGWLNISYKRYGQPNLKYLNVEIIRGSGTDRFIPSNVFVTYIAVGDEMDTVHLRRALGDNTRRPPDFSRDDSIKLEVKVSRSNLT